MTLSATLAWRYLIGRGARSLLTTLAVALGVMLTFGLNGITPAGGRVLQPALLGRPDRPHRHRLLQPVLPGHGHGRAGCRAGSSPETQRTAPLPPSPDPGPDDVTQLTVIGIDPSRAAKVRDFPLAAGRMLTSGDGFALVLPGDLAARMGVGVGDAIVLPSALGTARFKESSGCLAPASPAGSVFVPLAAAQQVFSLGSGITVLQAAFATDADRAATEQAVAAALGPDFQVGGLSSQTGLIASLRWPTTPSSCSAALATAGFIILNSFRTVVAERRRDIGMLRAIGTRRRTIVTMFALRAVLQGLLGTALGIALGWAMATALFAAMNGMVQSLLHMELGEPVFSPAVWTMSILLGVGVTLAATLVPARAAGRVTPLEAMRPQLGESTSAGSGCGRGSAWA